MKQRLVAIATMTSMMVVGLIGPAMATKPDEGGHKVTVCHATNSATNPYVVITIDVAGWEDGDLFVRHSPAHHQNSKNGHFDAVYNPSTEECEGVPTDTSGPGPTDT